VLSLLTNRQRNALWHFGYTIRWDQGDPAASDPELLVANLRQLSLDMDKMRAITPTGGAYQNEADLFEPDPVSAYWGQENYNRLLKLKRELDPDNMLSCFNCIGWERNDARHACYPDIER
jgi:hypothetical protein